jgi:hypothetical protein
MVILDFLNLIIFLIYMSLFFMLCIIKSNFFSNSNNKKIKLLFNYPTNFNLKNYILKNIF